MGYATTRFEKAAAPHLEDAEQVIGGTWARTPGGFASERAFGMVAGIASQMGSGPAGDVRLPKAFEVAVTPRRLLFFSRSAMTGRPHELVATVALEHVAVVEHRGHRGGIEAVSVRLRNGATIDFEVAKLGARKLAESFVECLNTQLVGARCAS